MYSIIYEIKQKVFVADPVDSALTVSVSVVITIVHQPRWSETGERGYGNNEAARGNFCRRAPHERKQVGRHSDDAALLML